MAEDGHSQQDDAIDVHYRPPQRLLGGVCHLQLHGFLLFLCHLGAFLLIDPLSHHLAPWMLMSLGSVTQEQTGSEWML